MDVGVISYNNFVFWIGGVKMLCFFVEVCPFWCIIGSVALLFLILIYRFLFNHLSLSTMCSKFSSILPFSYLKGGMFSSLICKCGTSIPFSWLNPPFTILFLDFDWVGKLYLISIFSMFRLVILIVSESILLSPVFLLFWCAFIYASFSFFISESMLYYMHILS